MSQSTLTGTHPVVAAVAEAREGLAPTADAPLWSLSDAELEALHDDTRRLLGEIAAVRAQVLAELHLRQVTTRSGAANTAAWLRGRDRLTGPDASRQAKVAAFLTGPEGEPLREAMWDTRVNADQAAAIVAVLKHAPPSAGPRVCGARHWRC